MTRITINNVQRLATPKAGNSVIVLVFCTLYYGDTHLYKVSRKYLGQFSCYTNTSILQKSLFSKFKGPTP